MRSVSSRDVARAARQRGRDRGSASSISPASSNGPPCRCREILADALKLQDIAARIECRLEGDGSIDIRGVAGIEDAGPGDLTFFTNPKYAAELRSTRASAVILGESAEAAPCAMLRTRQPYLAFARAVALFEDPWRPRARRAPARVVGEGRQLGADVSIGPFAVIGEARASAPRTIVHPHVTIGRQSRSARTASFTRASRSASASASATASSFRTAPSIGSDGFGFARRADGTHHKIPQIGAHRHRRRRRDRRQQRDRSAGGRARRASAPAPRSTTSSRSLTASSSAATCCSRRRSASRAA